MNAAAGAAPLPRLLCIMGSGETTPTMVPVHADLLPRLGTRPVAAVLVGTPFGFQENAGDISEKTVAYFRDRVGCPISVASFRNRELATPLEYETMLARVAEARYVFAGPGSPSYALRQWLDTAVPDLLAAKLRDGGRVTLASAAAVGLGVCSLPVYEVYKVGEEPRWLDGLNLLGVTGLRAAVVPHYNNAEGGTHDTRYCYMGERRLRIPEAALPDGCGVLGVDEHTACIIDADRASVTVRGRGRVIWRRDGIETHWRAPDTVSVEELISGGDASRSDPPRATAPFAPVATDREGTDPFMEQVSAQRGAGVAALAARDPDGVAAAILAMETVVHDWSRDTLQSDEPDRAREALRELVVRLAELAHGGAVDPRERVAPFVDAMLALRDRARPDGRVADADALRDALLANGIEVRDSPQGSTWELEAAPTG